MKMPVQATNVWARLTAPHSSIADLQERRQSILLSNFLLVVMTLDVLILVIVVINPGGSLALQQLTLATVLVGLPVAAGLYYLNRQGKYLLSARLFIITLFVVVHATLPMQSVPLNIVYFDSVLLILASILLPPPDIVILAVSSIGWQLLMTLIAPKESMTSTSGAMIVSAGIAALVLVSVNHRTQVEDERRAQSEALLAAQNKREQDTRRFQEQLRTLHEIGIELDSANSVDDLFRMAVELGRSRLGFDRMGIWLYQQNYTTAHGTFGTDDYGNTLDERNLSIPIAEYGLTHEERKAGRGSGPYGVIGPIVTGEQQLILVDPDILASASGEILGNGWCAQAALWDGEHPVGHISADNLIHQRPVAPYQLDLLSLYGTTLGHLYTRKQAEEALRQSEQRYSVISGLISDYAFSCKVLPGGGFTAEWMTDDAYKRITGYHWTEIGSTFNLYHPDDAAQAQQDVERVINGQDTEGEYRIITKSGELKWLRILRQPEWDAAHEKVVRYYAAAEDITERKRAEEARKTAEDANRVKSQFLANMSHELRTPLNAILNFTAFVADGVFGPINDSQADALEQAVSSAKHLLSLINDILDLTKIEVGLMDLFIQQVDVNEALAAAVSVAKGLIKDKPVELITEIDPDLPRIFGDTRRIRQIFLNLVSNAVKFTVSGSINIIAHCEKDRIHVAIRDTGIGIAPQDQTVIFESFKQAPNDLPGMVGTGLGLPISKYFVEAHGGVLWLESEVGKGSTFHVELPIRTEEQANAHRTPDYSDSAA